MIIEQLRLKYFRNIAEAKIEDLSVGLNLFCGPNGAGKTMFLRLLVRLISQIVPRGA